MTNYKIITTDIIQLVDSDGISKGVVDGATSEEECIVKHILNKIQIKYTVSKRIHSGFGSEKWQYEIKICNLKGIFEYYTGVGFSIKRKQDKLRKVIESYNSYPREIFNKAKELHKQMGFRKVAKTLNVGETVVYNWLFKNYQDNVLDIRRH